MTNAEKYLATIDRWLYKEDDEFTKFLRSELKTVVETEELAPADETEKILNSSDVNTIDIFKASGIWLIYMTRHLYPNTSMYHVIKDFKNNTALAIVSAAWIIKNLGVKNNFRDAMLGMDIADNIENLWRYYEYENIYFIEKYGSPVIYKADKYSPLVSAFGDAESWHNDADNSEWFSYATLVNNLFKLNPDDSVEMNDKRFRLMRMLYYVAFVEYPANVSRWMERTEDNEYLPLPDAFLASMLYKASNLSLREDDEAYTAINVTSHIEKYDDKGLDEILAYCEKKIDSMTDDRMKGIYTVYMGHITLYLIRRQGKKEASTE